MKTECSEILVNFTIVTNEKLTLDLKESNIYSKVKELVKNDTERKKKVIPTSFPFRPDDFPFPFPCSQNADKVGRVETANTNLLTILIYLLVHLELKIHLRVLAFI